MTRSTAALHETLNIVLVRNPAIDDSIEQRVVSTRHVETYARRWALLPAGRPEDCEDNYRDGFATAPKSGTKHSLSHDTHLMFSMPTPKA